VQSSVSSPTTTVVNRLGPLQHRDFTLLWAGLLVSNSGTWMQSVAQGWLAYALTNSPLWLGLLGAAFALPMIALPLVGGTIADRVDRLVILRITQTLMLACAAILAALTLARVVSIWHMVALTLISSCALAVDNPTRQALIPDLVPRSELFAAISLNSVAFNGAALIGPALAGVLLKTAGGSQVGDGLYTSSAVLFTFNTLSFLAVLVPVFIIRPRPVPRSSVVVSFQAALLEGIVFVRRRPALLLLLVLSACASVFGRSFSQLLPVFARDVLAVGSDGFGLMLALPGAGTLAAGFSLAWLGRGIDRRRLIVIALLGLVGSVVIFSFSRAFLPSLALLFLNGFFATVFGSVAATILQTETEGQLRGRVMSLYAITLIGLGPLGSVLSGALASYLPIGTAVAVPSLVILVVLAYAASRPAWQQVK
jgi:MFS family permease